MKAKQSKTDALRALREKSFSPDGALIVYDSMVTAIEKCHRVDEVKDIRDKALALQYYARQAQNIEAERKASEIRIRAERRCGQLLAELQKGKGGGDRKSNHSVQPEPSDYAQAKQTAGISDTQATRFQRLAAMPHEDFEGKLQDPLIKPSTAGMLGLDKQPVPSSRRGLFVWGQLKDLEREGVLNDDLNEIVSEMSEPLQGDVRKVVPKIIDWLSSLEGV